MASAEEGGELFDAMDAAYASWRQVTLTLTLARTRTRTRTRTLTLTLTLAPTLTLTLTAPCHRSPGRSKTPGRLR